MCSISSGDIVNHPFSMAASLPRELAQQADRQEHPNREADGARDDDAPREPSRIARILQTPFIKASS
jgi:hypothetical protein